MWTWVESFSSGFADPDDEISRRLVMRGDVRRLNSLVPTRFGGSLVEGDMVIMRFLHERGKHPVTACGPPSRWGERLSRVGMKRRLLPVGGNAGDFSRGSDLRRGEDSGLP